MPDEVIKFKHDWRPFAIGMQVILLVEILIYFGLTGNPSVLTVGIAILPIMLLSSILLVRFIDFVTPLVIESDGIRCYTGFGAPATVKWKDVKTTRNLIFWPRLKWIFLNDGRNVFIRPCIPVFIQNKELFFSQVVKAAGEDHLVVKRLRENGFGPK
jgi:predicted signal transduction protein with EAL and GGDEF domain